MESKFRRYILDPLYGKLCLPEYIWKILTIPELQRLREVRLCNINSLCLTGGANINRYEHSIGTYHLASMFIDSNYPSISVKEKIIFELAAIFHDIYNGPFGHSYQYVDDRHSYELGFNDYTSYKRDEDIQTRYKQVYFGMSGEIQNVLRESFNAEPSKVALVHLSDLDIHKIGDYINGNGELGKMISGSIDLDNIDNVFRLAFHVGLTNDVETPVILAKSLKLENGKLIITDDVIPYVRKWQNLRKKLYRALLLNPDEFSAKLMLTEGIEETRNHASGKIVWSDVDFEVFKKIGDSSSEGSRIVTNLLKGNLYGCLGIYSTMRIDKYGDFLHYNQRTKIEEEIRRRIAPEVRKHISDFSADEIKVIKTIKGLTYSYDGLELVMTSSIKAEMLFSVLDTYLAKHKNTLIEMYNDVLLKISKFFFKSPIIGLHPILDVNKTDRCIEFYSSAGVKKVIGESSNRLLIGVFMKNKEITNHYLHSSSQAFRREACLDNIRNDVREFLRTYLNDDNVISIDLFEEIHD